MFCGALRERLTSDVQLKLDAANMAVLGEWFSQSPLGNCLGGGWGDATDDLKTFSRAFRRAKKLAPQLRGIVNDVDHYLDTAREVREDDGMSAVLVEYKASYERLSDELNAVHSDTVSDNSTLAISLCAGTALLGLVLGSAVYAAAGLAARVRADCCAHFVRNCGVPCLVVEAASVTDANASALEVLGGGVVGVELRRIFPEHHHDLDRDSTRTSRKSARTPSGAIVDCLVATMTARDKRRLIFLEDLTPLSRAKRDLDIQKRILAQLVHELRNWVAPASSLLEQALDGDCRDKKDLKLALAQLHEAQALIQSRLELEKLYSGSYDPCANVETICIREFLQRCIQAARALAEPGVRFDTSVPQEYGDYGAVYTRLDVYMLRHLGTNLVSNARKHTLDRGVVSFDFLGDVNNNGMLHFAVSDTGRGVPSDIAARLFQEQVATPDCRSVGLGLASCAVFAKAAGGTIELERTHVPTLDDPTPGGSTFCFSLPGYVVVGDEPSLTESRGRASGDRRSLPPAMRFYVVDDSAIVRRTIVHKMRMLGNQASIDFTFREFSTVESILPSISELVDDPDVVVSVDENLTTHTGGLLHGSDLIRALRATTFKGIIVSASGDDKSAAVHQSLGAHFSLGKPYPPTKRVYEMLAAAYADTNRH